MPHPLVNQLRFARSEFQRGLEGVTDAEARRRFEPMNSISWMVGHLANQEQGFWLFMAQDEVVVPELRALVGYGKPATTPPLDEMWDAWRTVTAAADAYLDGLDAESLQTYFEWKGEPIDESVGTLLLRNIYHYWYHNGEASAVRQLLGHTDLPEFVGDMTTAAYQP